MLERGRTPLPAELVNAGKIDINSEFTVFSFFDGV